MKTKPTLKRIQALWYPTCGSGPGEECELSSGQSRAEPHADRLLTCLGLIDVLTPK